MSYEDRFSGTGYDDTLSGNQGNDSIEGNRGQDLIYGGTGDDTLRGDHQSDLIEGGEGDDRLFGGANADVLIGGEGDDTVIGGNQADLLFGGEGTNELLGGDGNDTLVSTGTDDTLAGGQGADLYSISTSENAFIDGWSADQGDLISFQGQYTDPDDLRDRMVEVTYNDGRPGDLIIEHDGGTRTTIIGAAGQQESVIASLFDPVAPLVDGKVIGGPPLDTPQALALHREPKANVARYDGLRARSREAAMRHDPAAGAIVIMLRSLKMYGMAQAVTDLIEQGAPAFEAAIPMLSQLLKAELAEREVRSIAYHMKSARFPAYKDLAPEGREHGQSITWPRYRHRCQPRLARRSLPPR